MPPTTLYIDSRHRRPGTPIHDAQWQYDLIRPIQNARSFRLKSIQLANTLHNITPLNNTLSVNGGTVEIAPAFWTASQLVLEINDQLGVLWGPYGGGGEYLVLDFATNRLTWTISTNTIDVSNSSMAAVLGLPASTPPLTGAFTSQIFLAVPQYISFTSPDLRSSDHQAIHASSTNARRELQPFLTVPIGVGYGEIGTYAPDYERIQRLGGKTLSQIRIKAVDPSTARKLEELTHYAMLIELA